MTGYRSTISHEYAPMDSSRYTRKSALQPPRIRAQAAQAAPATPAPQAAQAQAQKTTEQPGPAKSIPAPSVEDDVYEGLTDLASEIAAMQELLSPSNTPPPSPPPHEAGTPVPRDTQSPTEQPDEDWSSMKTEVSDNEAQDMDYFTQPGEFDTSTPLFERFCGPFSRPLARPRPQTKEDKIRHALKHYNRVASMFNGSSFDGDEWHPLVPLRSETCYFERDGCIDGCEIEDFPGNVHELGLLNSAELNGLLGHLGAMLDQYADRKTKIEWVLKRWIDFKGAATARHEG